LIPPDALTLLAQALATVELGANSAACGPEQLQIMPSLIVAPAGAVVVAAGVDDVAGVAAFEFVLALELFELLPHPARSSPLTTATDMTLYVNDFLFISLLRRCPRPW
jgi:hypothetical protein